VARSGKVKRSPGNTQGAYGKNHIRPVRALVDYDYLNKLPPKDKAWLARFTDEQYGGKFTGLNGKDERKALDRERNHRRQDVYAIAEGIGTLRYNPDSDDSDSDSDSAGVDEAPAVTQVPAYLSSPEYKAALAKYRSYLPITERNRKQVESDYEYIRALAILRATKNQG
jgi:hypothetical protein